MSDDLVKRYRLDGQYDVWGMEDAESGEPCADGRESLWVKAADHAAALVAKDAEIARLRLAVELFVAYDNMVDASGVQMILAYDDAITAARDALNTQHKGDTP